MWTLYPKLGYCINSTVSISADPLTPFDLYFFGIRHYPMGWDTTAKLYHNVTSSALMNIPTPKLLADARLYPSTE